MAASIYGELGQSAPGATTLTTVYTVPSARRASVKIVAANRGAATAFRVAISPNGAGIVNQHYIAYDKPIDANDSLITSGITLGDTDVVRVYGTSANMSFTVSGIEEDA